MALGLENNLYRVISAKTASYRVQPEDIGTTFTNRGASGAVTFTLPNPTDIQTGWWCRFFGAVLAQNWAVASYNSADDITTFNDLTADSLTFSTASERAGGAVEVVWDGTGWLAFLFTEETQTVTVA